MRWGKFCMSAVMKVSGALMMLAPYPPCLGVLFRQYRARGFGYTPNSPFPPPSLTHSTQNLWWCCSSWIWWWLQEFEHLTKVITHLHVNIDPQTCLNTHTHTHWLISHHRQTLSDCSSFLPCRKWQFLLSLQTKKQKASLHRATITPSSLIVLLFLSRICFRESNIRTKKPNSRQGSQYPNSYPNAYWWRMMMKIMEMVLDVKHS